MGRVRAHGVTISLDGFMAGREQSLENPLGVGGQSLHDWAFATRSMRRLHGMEGGSEGEDDRWAAEALAGVGATIMGRNMFGPVRGPWPDNAWRGWWGEDPPFHHPVFVLTHHARDPIPMEGGTTFHFVTDGIEAALARAREAAGAGDIQVGGGAATLRQFLGAGLLDEIHVAVVPRLLGAGERLFDGLEALPDRYQCVEHSGTDAATHIRLVRQD